MQIVLYQERSPNGANSGRTPNQKWCRQSLSAASRECHVYFQPCYKYKKEGILPYVMLPWGESIFSDCPSHTTMQCHSDAQIDGEPFDPCNILNYTTALSGAMHRAIGSESKPCPAFLHCKVKLTLKISPSTSDAFCMPRTVYRDGVLWASYWEICSFISLSDCINTCAIPLQMSKKMFYQSGWRNPWFGNSGVWKMPTSTEISVTVASMLFWCNVLQLLLGYLQGWWIEAPDNPRLCQRFSASSRMISLIQP